MKTFLMVVGVAFVGLASVLLSTHWIVVDVTQKDEGGRRIIVPAPLALARVAAYVAADSMDPIDLDFDDELEYLPLALTVVRELRNEPDFDLVRVDQADEQVLVRKEGDWLRVAVDNDSEMVRVRVPLAAIEQALEAIGDDGTLEIATLVAAASHVSKGRLVEVHDEDVDVLVSIW